MNPNPAAREAPGSKPVTAFIRDLSRGVNLSTAREAIADNECWWLEGAIPIAPGNLSITPGPQVADAGGWHTAVAAETGVPSFLYTFNVSGTDYIFAVWKNSGNGWVGTAIGTGVTRIFNGVLTSGTTAAAQWNNNGILIIDPTGYWDWNVTTAATLTAISNSVQSISIVDGGSGYTSAPGAAVTGGGGAGGTATAFIGLGSAAVAATGVNYKVGDILTLPYGFSGGGELMTVKVTTVNATGGVTGVGVNTVGKGVTFSANPIAALGGSGTGATFNVVGSVTFVRVDIRGSGYTGATSLVFTGGGFVRAATATVNLSGSLVGTAIAVYAGRAWIASGRGVTFTDAGAYASFVGSGSSFVIQDDYLHDGITALYAANNYLYIFGVDSIDVLSNVTVTAAGTASFSRVNVTASIGCNQPYSIFSYYRSLVFANSTGFYVLSGASPEKISDALDLLIPTIDYSAIYRVYGGQVTVAGELCAAWSITFTNSFVGGGALATMLVVYFKGKWFFARQAINGTPLTLGPIVSIPPVVGGNQFFLYTLDSAQQFYLLLRDATQTYWRVWTKLYDCDAPMFTKQATRTALGVTMGGLQSSRAGLAFSVDTEIHAPGQLTTLPAGTFSGYKAFMGSNNEGGGQFMGLTLTGIASTQADVTRIQWLAFQYSKVTEWAA